MPLTDRLFRERYAPVPYDDSGDGWSRTRDKDMQIRWRITRHDSDGTPWTFTFHMPEQYVATMGVAQARWVAATELRALLAHIREAIQQRNEMIAAYRRGVKTWH